MNYALRLLGNQYLVEIKTDVELGTGPVTIVSAVENKDKISQLWENSEQVAFHQLFYRYSFVHSLSSFFE